MAAETKTVRKREISRTPFPLPKRAGRPRDDRATKAILDVTLRHLARYGFAGLSMEAIAEEAGVTKPTLYRRWSSREDLLTAAISEWRNRDMPAPTGDPVADLQANLRQTARLLKEREAFAIIAALLQHEATSPQLMELYRERALEPRKNAIRSILRAAQHQGRLPKDLDMELTIAMLVGAYYWKVVSGEPIPDSWPAKLVETVFRERKR